MDCAIPREHCADERDRVPLSVPWVFAISWSRHHFAVSAGDCDLCALRSSPCRRLAPDLRGHRDDFPLSECLHFFVLIVQAFLKVPALKAMAPTQSEPPLKATQ